MWNENRIIDFKCPITEKIMSEPVIASDGHTYERYVIEKWNRTNQTSPKTREKIEDRFFPNLSMKNQIEEFKEYVRTTKDLPDYLKGLTFPYYVDDIDITQVTGQLK